MSRRLSPDERAIWRRVTETVQRGRSNDARTAVTAQSGPGVAAIAPSSVPNPAFAQTTRKAASNRQLHNTLDGGWDKRISKGELEPDFTIDLHGETLASAHAKLNRTLLVAIRNGSRIVLLITGKKAADSPRLPPTSRGIIRASVKDWLTASPNAAHIAAIRGAHPRHGGAGALYVILRRGR